VIESERDEAVISSLNLELARGHFPALASEWAFLDNGGGSQILQPVIDRIQDYLLTSNVQLGASYAVSRLASERLAEAERAVATLVNAEHSSEVVMGPSTTVLIRTLASSVGDTISVGDEVIVTNGDHEANIGPWMALEERGAVIRFWEADPHSGELRLEDLGALLGPRTRLVAVTHASNILGTINPIREIADMVHEHDAWLCVDGVGFAPHRAVDVRALGVDFYAFSFYKTFGPHHAVLYGKLEHLTALPGQSLYFIEEDDVPYKYQPGNVNYELSYGMLGLMDYLAELDAGSGGEDVPRGASVDRAIVDRAFDKISAHEEVLGRLFLDFLATKNRVRVVGQSSADRSIRVPIISFTVDGASSESIVKQIDEHQIGIRYGNFYSTRLIEALGLSTDDGVVRVSMVHYNTVDEIDRLNAALDRLL
jgi:cysteine desulfurase family protein (TIGR01976 family)